MRQKSLVLILVILLAMAIAGCIPAASGDFNGQVPTEAGLTTPAKQTEPTHEIGIPEQPLPDFPPKGDGFKGQISIPETPDVTTALVAVAKKDLAVQLKISQDDIQLLSVEPKTWPDSSLGVYESGKMYSQVVTPGYLIQLEYQGVVYDYHTDNVRVVFAGKQ